MVGERAESILAFDCGSALSKAVLIDKVAGEFRFIAVGEAATTPGKAAEGLAEAASDIEAKTGRHLLHGDALMLPEGLDGSGVDATVLAWSAGQPLRLVAAGVASSQSTEDAAAVAAGAAAEVVASFCLQDIRGKDRREEKVKQIRESQADVLLLVTGADRGGALLAEICDFIARLGLVGKNGTKFPLLLVGSRPACIEVANILGAVLDLYMVGSVRSAAVSSTAGPAICRLNDLYVDLSTDGGKHLGALLGDKWSAKVAAPRAVDVVAQFMARRIGASVLVVDVGASATTLAAASGGGGNARVWPRYGMGTGIGGVLAGTGIASIAKWLPFACDEERALAVGLNKSLRPLTVPQLAEELSIEEAFARAAIENAYRSVEIETGAIVATGGFLTHLPDWGRIALLLLDALQPGGVTTLFSDELGLLPSLGAVAHAFPQAAGEVLFKDALVTLGAAVALPGSGRDGKPAARVRIESAEGGEAKVEVCWGEIRVIPLAEGHKARLTVQPAQDSRLGENRKRRIVDTEVSGGVLGVIVDARGRPLTLSSDPGKRIEKLSAWRSAMQCKSLGFREAPLPSTLIPQS
ncbi:MAG: glutamate mutase L [Chloroflexi bacterium]|nr:glutamate mutase L [Chloroflexota bacterium]